MTQSQFLKVHVIIGSTRKGRFSEKAGEWILETAHKYKELQVTRLDLRDYPLPFFDEPTFPMMSHAKYSNPAVQKWSDAIADADAYIVISPEYDHGIPAVLKNAFDHTFAEWTNKPMAFVSYGSVGGARAVEQLRLVSIELQMAPIRQAVHIPMSTVMSVLMPKDGVVPEKPLAPFDSHAHMLIDQLIWWARALKTARETK